MPGSPSPRKRSTLTGLAKLGFVNLAASSLALSQVPADVVPEFERAADPDQALHYLSLLEERDAPAVRGILEDRAAAGRLIRVLGASAGLGEFLRRRPAALALFRKPVAELPQPEAMNRRLQDSVKDREGEEAIVTLRVAYRELLTEIAIFDLELKDPLGGVDSLAAALADLAGAAIVAAIDLATSELTREGANPSSTSIAVIGMGKTGARELNYLSDVDVLYVASPVGEATVEESVRAATAIAKRLTRILHGPSPEPGLWELDANLRPEGKSGVLVRSLDSYLAYYERWAKGWEFQALLKARPIAGDLRLGAQFVDAVQPLVWSSASKENFVESVQKMRERVTAHIPEHDRDVQVKLGEGGLRDIEFTTQLLQLVHGQTDERVRQRSTLGALAALVEFGYIGRTEAERFGIDYRTLRLIEHRLQLRRLTRTHLMPRDEPSLRVLARATGLAPTADGLLDHWRGVKAEVHSLHERLFYRPLLSAVAALPEESFALSSDQAQARLGAIGFKDPAGALRHIAALTEGLSRRATIQRNLLPVILQWLSEGTDPDHGLLIFRRLSDALGESHWYLRMLRDSSGAAHRLMKVLSTSRFVGDLFERIPESIAWLEDDAELKPRSLDSLSSEAESIATRYSDDSDSAALAIRAIRRRETLRLAIGSILNLIGVEELGEALSDLNTAVLRAFLSLATTAEAPSGFEFAIIALGRFGGRELGFGSDADIIYVYRSADAGEGQKAAERIVSELNRLTEDFQLPFELDIDLRPEGKNGPVVRSLESYRAYYERWSLTWEAQALLRAKGTAGSEPLIRDFLALADEIRYPNSLSERDVREIRRIKARVEAERLPRGADPSRHLKLGRGSISDVEWLVQLIQLQRAATDEKLRTTSTLRALKVAADTGAVSRGDARILREAWLLASRCRSALYLWTAKTTDVLPRDRSQLEGVARLLGLPAGSANRLEDEYLRTTRRSRAVFERLFYET